MITEAQWRKFPRDIIRNEELDFVSSMLAPELAAAPLIFMTVAYCRADNDGVFDLEHGHIFSRLMRIGRPEDAVHIAELLSQRGVLIRLAPERNIFFISDWDHKQDTQYEQKLAANEKRKEAILRKYRDTSSDGIFSSGSPAPQFAQPQQQGFQQPAQSDAFFCPDEYKKTTS